MAAGLALALLMLAGERSVRPSRSRHSPRPEEAEKLNEQADQVVEKYNQASEKWKRARKKYRTLNENLNRQNEQVAGAARGARHDGRQHLPGRRGQRLGRHDLPERPPAPC
ncbi:hypothetical protein GCM10018952_67850 [Streptosporangium vulgare]